MIELGFTDDLVDGRLPICEFCGCAIDRPEKRCVAYSSGGAGPPAVATRRRRSSRPDHHEAVVRLLRSMVPPDGEIQRFESGDIRLGRRAAELLVAPPILDYPLSGGIGD